MTGTLTHTHTSLPGELRGSDIQERERDRETQRHREGVLEFMANSDPPIEDKGVNHMNFDLDLLLHRPPPSTYIHLRCFIHILKCFEPSRSQPVYRYPLFESWHLSHPPLHPHCYRWSSNSLHIQKRRLKRLRCSLSCLTARWRRHWVYCSAWVGIWCHCERVVLRGQPPRVTYLSSQRPQGWL